MKKLAALCAFLSCMAQADDHLPEVKTLQPGVTLTLVVEQPDIATPTGIDVDDQGRVWAVSCHTHLPPKDYPGPKQDEVLIFGKDGSRTVFYAATDQTMDLELGSDGWVYLSERDRILRVKDSDDDGKGDVEEVLVELKSEADYPHNALSGLAWDRHGDLVFGLGENFAKPWTLTARDGSLIAGADRGGVFRMGPDGSELHKIAEGLWNPFGVTVREDGEIFAAENDPGEYPPCKVLHIVEGGDYGYRRKYGSEAHHPFVCWNGESRGTLPMVHPSGEAPCGVVPLGRGLLMPSWGDHQIDFFRLIPQGASFTGEKVTLVHGSRYFRPACIAPDPSQSNADLMTWYLTDWVDGRYPVHGYGRIWKLEIDLKAAAWVGPLTLAPKNPEAVLAESLRTGKGGFSEEELFAYSRHSDAFISSAALSDLARCSGDWSVADFQKLPDSNRIEAVIALKLAAASPDKWISTLLDDPGDDVVFETLRWIADDELKAFLPDVEKILAQSDLSFSIFEAAVATRITLLGKPEIGLRDDEMLLTRVRDDSSSPVVRAYALRLLPKRSTTAPKDGSISVSHFPEGLTLELLEKLLSIGHHELSLEAIRVLAGNPVAGQKILASIASDAKQNDGLRAEAILGLTPLSDQHLDLLLSLAESPGQPVREEALRAMRGATLTEEARARLTAIPQKYGDAGSLVKALTNPETLLENRPAFLDADAWEKRLGEIDGPADPEAGRRIFHHPKVALCANCHRHSGRGNVVGPDLSHLSQAGDETWLLEAILNPNKDIAPQFLPRRITLNDGKSYLGIRLRSYVNEQIRDANGQNHTFNRDDVRSIEDLDLSFMPAGLALSLTDRELRDLIAFLRSPQ